MKNKIFSKAASGEQAQASATLNGAARVDIDVQPADRLNLHSPKAALAARKRAGNALELEFEDGQLVSLEGFYAPQSTDAVPTLVVSTGEVKEVFVGAVEGSAEVAQGTVEGTTLPAQVTGPCEVRQQQGVDAFGGPRMVGGPGELFTGFPEDTSRMHPYCGNDLAVGDGFSETPQAMAGSDNEDFLMGLFPFAPQFLAFASLFSAAAVAAAVKSDDEPVVTPPAAPTMTIDAISTDSGDSDTLSALVDGGFVASWTSTTKILGDSSGSGTYMRFFDAAGHVRALNEYHPADAAIRIEPSILVGGSPNADAYNTAQQAANSNFDVANDGLSANGDTPSSLWKAEVTITNFHTGDTLGWDAALATSSGITATYDGAGHLTMLIGSGSTLAGIESVLRSVTYSGGANPAAGDRTIQFSLTDKAGAVTTQESGITVSSPALSLAGTAGNDTLTGGNGHDGLITNGGVDNVSGGAGDDRIYESNSALAGQYNGGTGFDTLVFDFTGSQTVLMNNLAPHVHGIERIDLGNSAFKTNNTTLQIDQLDVVQGMVDSGTTRMLIQGDASDSVRLANATGLHKVSVSSQDGVYFDIYQATGNDLQLWLQQGLQVATF